MLVRQLGLIVTAFLLLIATGCTTCCKKKCNDCQNDRIPPGAALGAPGNIPPAGIPPRSTYYSPQPEILLPENRTSVPLYNSTPSASDIKLSQKPNELTTQKSIASMPLGIPEFAMIKEGIWTGLRPDLDGLEWLKNNNFKKVIYIREGSEDEQSDRMQIEKRGMNFESFVVKPDTLSVDLYRQFAAQLTTAKPIFVYDRNAASKGYLWFAYFRINEMLSPDTAKVRAERLGYSDVGSADRKELALATQRIIDQSK